MKQRRDSLEVYEKQGRDDLAAVEKGEIEIIEAYLPKQLSEEEVTEEIRAIVAEVGASSMKDMGKVMGAATKKWAGKADGKLISQVVKAILNG